jgi:hypothetical protein
VTRDASLAAHGAMLRSREEALERANKSMEERESEVARRADSVAVASARLVEDQQRLAALDADLAERLSLVRPREEVVETFYSMLGCVQDAIVAPNAANTDAAITALQNVTRPPSQPLSVAPAASEPESAVAEAGSEEGCAPAFEVSREPAMVAHEEPSPEPVVGPAPARAAITEGVVPEAEEAPAVDISDFSAEELEMFNVRRRLGYRSDAVIAAEIRGERAPQKPTPKKRGWFSR